MSKIPYRDLLNTFYCTSCRDKVLCILNTTRYCRCKQSSALSTTFGLVFYGNAVSMRDHDHLTMFDKE